MEDNIVIQKGIGQRASGEYKVMVVDEATDKVVYESDWQKNLILNQGMNAVAARTWADCYAWAICGTGTTSNSIDSSTDTADQVGTTVTNTGAVINFSTAVVAGDMIKWDTGEEAMVTSITSASIVEVTPTQSVSGGAYTIWKTARVGLETEVKRTSTKLGGAGNCGATRSGATIRGFRTFDFTTESGSVTYTEVGVGWASSAASTVFSRVVLSSPVSLVIGQKLRLVYALNLVLSPSTNVSKTLGVTGWTSDTGSECIQVLGISCPEETTGGSSNFANLSGGGLDPFHLTNYSGTGTGRLMCVSTSSAALAAFGSATTRVTTAYLPTSATTMAAYVTNSFYTDLSTLFGLPDAVSSSIRSIMLGYSNAGSSNYPYDALRQVFTFVLDNPQAKTNTQTLTLTIRFTWSRVLK